MNEIELGWQAFCVVTAAGVSAGLVSMWAFRRFSDPGKLKLAANRMVAHLLEFRLFADEPAVVLRAQRGLLAANALLMWEIVTPTLILLLPFALLMSQMEALFGRAPLPLGGTTVVTIECRPLKGEAMPKIDLKVPSGIQIETPPVHVPRLCQISWRIRARQQTDGVLQAELPDRSIAKSISSGAGWRWLSPVRGGSFFEALLHPSELPFEETTVRSIAVEYPAATIFGTGWIVWFSLGALSAAGVSALLWR